MDTDHYVRHFDHQDPELMIAPHAVYAELRQHCPVAHSDRHNGFWVISRYEDVWRVATDAGTFSSAHGVGIPPPAMPPQCPQEYDPPEHTPLRKLVLRRLSPQSVAKLEPRIVQVTNQLIDSIVQRGCGDLVTDLAAPMTAVLICELVGVPEREREEFQEWLRVAVRERINDPAAAQIAGTALATYLTALLDERRVVNERHDDFTDVIVHARIDGHELTPEQQVGYVMLLISGGLETTTNAIGTTLLYLDEHPDERQRLIDHPELIPTALEEFLRWVSPIQGLGRTVMRQVEIAGKTLEPGSKVFIAYGSANRDATVFADGESCLLDRSQNRHMAFGVGVHRCLGSNLARTEYRIAIEQVLRRIPDYVVDRANIRWNVGESRGVSHLPVTLPPAGSGLRR